jgi:hypothetical protein
LQIIEEWRKLHRFELGYQYCSPNMIGVIKLKLMRCVWYVVCMGHREVYTGFGWGDLREREHSKDLGVDGSVILKWILKNFFGWEE